MVARDAFGFSLNYFTGDYKPVDATKTTFAAIAMNLPADPVSGISTGHQLFNGNIGAMAVNITKFNNPLVYGYRYDQLNRIVRMDAFNGLNNAANTFTANRLNDYHEEVSYDPNGNIRTYLRNGTTAGSSPLGMDNLAYTYTTNTNKLKRVTDAVSAGNYTEDIDNQSNSENYVYDAIGNLIEDKAEGIDSIHWTVYGKIKRIVKGSTAIDYTYDAAGNRISKAVTASAVTKTTYYVRDASGNVMSIYQAGDSSINSGDLTQTEVHLYGSSRLGIFNVNNNVLCAPDSTDLTIFTRGNKLFELSNHLGNVLVTISDKKIIVPEWVCGFAGCELMFHHYEADVVTANDYYPFGMNMPGRKFDAGSEYRYGFNGKEKSDEVYGEGNIYDYGFRIYNPRLGKFLSVDPLSKSYPWYTPYQFAGNKPIMAIDLDGLEEDVVIDKWAGVTYGFFEFDLGLGLGLGLNYTYQNGFAYDEVGKTKYSAELTLYVSNQVKEALDKNAPNFMAGASGSATVNIEQNWKYETYLGAIGAVNLDVPVDGIPKVKGLKLADIVAVNASISTNSVTIGIGVGYGIKLSVINTNIIQSVSLTDDEVNKVQDKAGVWFEMNAEWIVKNIQPVKNEAGTTTAYKSDLYTKDRKGKEVSTGISLISGALNSTKVENGKPKSESTSDNIWRSADYQKEATEAERKGGTIIK